MSIQPFTISLAQKILDDLHQRLRLTRWPDESPGMAWEQGTDLQYLKQLLAYWADEFDWRAQERRLNAFKQLLRARGGAAYHAFSAGTEPRSVHLLALRVMQEIGLDISTYQAKSLDVFRNLPPMDLVVTVCDEAAEACPYFPHARHQVHWGFPDPGRVEGSEEERLAAFRHIRDLIATRINQFLDFQPATSLEKLYEAGSALENPSERSL